MIRRRGRYVAIRIGHCWICLVTVVVVVTAGPVDDQLSSNDSSDENCCDEDITVLFLVPPPGSFSTVSDTDLVDSSDCTLLAFCSRCELAVSLVTCAAEKNEKRPMKLLLLFLSVRNAALRAIDARSRALRIAEKKLFR